jgi:CBS domain-containing protein
MFAVEDVMVSNLVTVRASATAKEAAKMMAYHRFGSLIVVPEGSDSMRVDDLGIITERDILTKVVAADRPTDVKVWEIMTKPLLTIDAKGSLSEASDMMNERHIRRLLVVRDGVVVGILSLRDVNKGLRFSAARGILHPREHDYFRHD